MFAILALFTVVTAILPALYLRFMKGMKNYDLTASKRVTVRCQASTASRYLRNARNLQDYEMKVKHSVVLRQYSGGLDYSLKGYAMGIPWEAIFEMKFLPCGGFWSHCIGGGYVSYVLPRGIPAGGFMLRSHDDDDDTSIGTNSTDILHTEKYLLPWGCPWGYMIASVWRSWLERSMEVEMEIIKESLELLEQQQEGTKAKLGTITRVEKEFSAQSTSKSEKLPSCLPVDHPAVQRYRSKRYGLTDLVWEKLGGTKLHLANTIVYS
jgi:hypothetical protein